MSTQTILNETVQLNNTTGGTDGREYDVAVIGAGPYGLSAGVHLQARGFSVRVFGEPMDFWATKMPQGMLLRSPREASSLSDPASTFSLEAYEAATGTAPVAPLPIETFVEYGRWFQRQLGTAMDRRLVLRVARENSSFKITLEDGADPAFSSGGGCNRDRTSFCESPQSLAICLPSRRRIVTREEICGNSPARESS